MALRAFAPLLQSIIAVALVASSGQRAVSAQAPLLGTVLSIYWSSETFPGTPELDASIQQALGSRTDRIAYFAEYLESDLFPDEEASLAFRDYIQRKYRGRTINAVIASTDVTLQFALRYREDLFPGVPIVFSAVATPDPSVTRPGSGLAGVVYGSRIAETARLALKLHPSTRKIFYVAEASDSTFRESIGAQLRSIADQVELTDITQPSLPRLIAAVKAVPSDSLILYIRYTRDAAGNALFSTVGARAVVEASPVPVYSGGESYLGTGIVGGVMSPRREVGTRMGEMVLDILHGTRPEDIPIAYPAEVPMFDWRQLRRWGIAEDSLPAGSQFLFRETSLFEQYRATILATAGVLLLQSLLIAGLVFEHRRRRRAELDSRRNLAAIAHLDRRAAMGELATSLAHELNQPLNAIMQNAGVAQMLLTSHPVPPGLGEIPDIISDIHRDDIRASDIIRRMRGLLQKHEPDAKPVQLNEVAHETVAIVRPDATSRQIQVEMDLANGLHAILGDRVHLQQVLLNLVMNAMDAVAAMPPDRRRVRVWSMRDNGEVRVGVADTGTGIPPERLKEIFEPFYTTKGDGRGMGMGLAIARGIVETHAGRMAAENNAGGGATVWFSIPVSRET